MKAQILTFIVAITTIFNFSFTQNIQHKKGMEGKSFNFNDFNNESETSNNYLWTELNKGYEEHPEFGKLPHNAPCSDCIELLGKRKVDLRHYVSNKDTSVFYIQRGNQPLHAKVNENWVSINHHLKKKNSYYESSNFLNTIRLAPSQNRAELYCSQSEKSIEFNQWKLYKTINGEKKFIANANWSSFSAGDDGMFVKNIFEGIDAEFIVMRGSIKTNFIVKQLDHLGEFNELIFSDHINDANGNISFQRENGNVIIASNNQTIAKYQEGIAYSLNDPKSHNTPILYNLENNNIEMKLGYNWLNETLKHGKLVIDPIVTGTNTLAQIAITGSLYNTSCNFDNSCDYNLTVPAPANATFDDVFWTFEYIAQGICWLEDGATRFSTGTCVSPSQNGFFWFCNQIGGGTCAGNNISVFNDLGGCLPAASCNPQNVVFTLEFFRRCYGPTGCDNSCIGANAPWTMTIQGQTIAYSNLTNPVTVSSTTVCQGDAITATTSGQDGVPPYTYEWSFDPSGIPVVATGASANITFPNSGNVTLYSIVTDACGNEVIESVNITVEAAPNLSVTATETEICVGESTTLTATGGGATYNWDNGLGTGATQTVSPTTTTTYNVTSSSTSGCPGVGSIEIIVNPLPNVQAGNDITVCEGDQVTLSATGTATNYTWNNGVTNGVPFTPPNGITSYTVTGELLGCEEQDEIIVTVQPEINFTVNGTDPSGCNINDGTITISNLPPNQSIDVSFTVNGTPVGPTNYTSDGAGNVIINNLGAGNYSDFEINFNSCASLNNTSVTLTNPNGPTVTAPADQTICVGDEITLTANASNGTISWSGGITDGVPFTPPLGVNTYTVTVDDNGCTNTDQVTITVNGPTVTIDNVQNPSCFNSDDGSATANALGGSDPYTYQWSPSGGNAATASGLGSGVYTVTITDADGCNASESITITAPDEIVLDGTTTPSECGEETGSINVTASGGAGGFTYNWNPNVSTSANATNIPSGDYEITVTDANGCSEVITLTVEQLNNIDVFIIPDNATIDYGQSVILNVETDPTSTIVSYSWSPSDGLSCTNCGDPTATPNQTTTYTVNIVTDEGCEGQAQITIEVIRECEETFIPTIFSPNNDNVNDELCIIGDCVDEIELSIYNRWGERVYQTSDPASCWRGNHRGRPVNSGVYSFKASIVLIDGTNIEEAGSITLVR